MAADNFLHFSKAESVKKRDIRNKLTLVARAGSAAALSIARPPATSGNVLMLHNGRSGSTLLGDLMDQHPGVFWDGETLEKKLHRIESRLGQGFATLYGSFDLDDGIAEIEQRMKWRAAGRIFGTELQDYHVEIMKTDIESYLQRLRNLGFDRFVFLERNYLRKIASHLVATKRDQFHINQGAKLAPQPVRINVSRVYVGHRITTLLEAMQQYRAFFQRAEAALPGAQILKLSYEQHIQNGPQPAVDELCQFLGLSPHHPKVNFGKTTDLPLDKVIENFDEVVDYIANTEFRDEVAEFIENRR
jgi:LPS sulfotransferase NodH